MGTEKRTGGNVSVLDLACPSVVNRSRERHLLEGGVVDGNRGVVRDRGESSSGCEVGVRRKTQDLVDEYVYGNDG